MTVDLNEFQKQVLRIKEIGVIIKDLSKESKALRASVANMTRGLGYDVNEEEPVNFLVGNLLVGVIKARDDADYTITLKDLKNYACQTDKTDDIKE